MPRPLARLALIVGLLGAAPAHADDGLSGGSDPAAEVRRPGRVREGWYVGLGLGLADGATREGGAPQSFAALLGADPTRLALEVEAGLTVTPRLLVGADLTFAGAAREGSDPTLGRVTRGVRVLNLDAVATLFPFVEGFHLRAGAGLSQLAMALDSTSGHTERHRTGVNVLGGVGWAFWIGETFNLCLNLDLSRQWYGGGGEPAGSSFAIAYAGFDWY